MKYSFVVILILGSCGSDLGYQNDFLETEDCVPCVKDVDPNRRYLECVPIPIDRTNFDFVGTWYQNTNQIDGIVPILDLRKDGVLRRVYAPGFEGNKIRSSKWEYKNEIFTEILGDQRIDIAVNRIGSHYVSLNIHPAARYGPMIRVQCQGFGFGGEELPENPNSCDCASNETCEKSPVSQGEICLPVPEFIEGK